MTAHDRQPIRLYRYVGPAAILEGVTGPAGARVRRAEDVSALLGNTSEPFTFIVDAKGCLVLAPRRTEHVACANGGLVSAAGEITFSRERDGRVAVQYASNQSTGYCPEPPCWAALAAVLDAIGVQYDEPGFTVAFEFRRCTACAQINLVKDDDDCAVCGVVLPAEWNFDTSTT